ncbi:MAG: preprotein translocase subunit SecA, partial [Erysipelotrichaceae bacterium]|nr:preprotein translocase subunit SecA [Erysipelotrichaceae bacterium]
LDKLFNNDKRILEEVERGVRPADQLKDQMAALSDDELKHKTVEFRERLAGGETLDDLMPEAFAVAREAAKRVNGEYPFFCQLEGAYVLHRGDIAEMKTGEGKTLTSVMAVYLNALEGKGVHVVTVNEYLAQRDSEWMGAIHRFLGLSVGLNLRALTPAQKKAAYRCDITYTTNSEVGFDYLRDNMVTRVEDRVLRELNYALVDEVDSILIDESRTPLIISGGEKKTANLYINADRFVKRLKPEEDYIIDVKERNVTLTEEGVHKAEKAFNVENLYDLDNTSLVHYIAQALKGNYIMTRDVEYVVEDNEVIIVDQNTGRKMPGREYSDGLHQALQAKEGVPIKQETTTWATITYQNFFRLYNKLAGMTGTAKTEEEEFLSIYNMRVVEIPTNRPVIRQDYPDLVFGTKKAKYNALLEEVKELYAKGQPVLVGTISVETSELISRMFKQARIRHEVLNAKNHAREAEIIAKAGREGAVTIATNMAGRGTDIKLTDRSRELGGLAVLGSERHESRRIDNQLRGRSGRQGDPGYSRFFVSLEDELMVRFGAERIKEMFSQLGDSPIESKMVSKAIESAQKRVEGQHFDVRKALLEYDDVLRKQRETIYEQRDEILEQENVHDIVNGMFDRYATSLVASHTMVDGRDEIVDYDGIREALETLNMQVSVEELKKASNLNDTVFNLLWNEYETKFLHNEELAEIDINHFEKAVVLKIIDAKWMDHIDLMSKLRENIHLRSYGKDNPLKAYTQEGYEMFEDMMNSISDEVIRFFMVARIEVRHENRS